MTRILTLLAIALTITITSSAAAQTPAPAEVDPRAEDHAEADEVAPRTSKRVAKKQHKPLMDVFLTDGQVIRGYVAKKGDDFEIELRSGGKMLLAEESVLRFQRIDEASIEGNAKEELKRDSHRSRYLYNASGMLLEQGEGYISQKELLFTAAAIGVTDHVTVLFGSALPVAILVPHLIFGVKAGGSVSENLHLSAGAETLILPPFYGASVEGLGVAFANVTLGNPSQHLTINGGVPFTFDGFERDALFLTLSGYKQINDRVGIVSENWLFVAPSVGGGVLANAAAARFTPGDFGVDLGFVFMTVIEQDYGAFFIPVPIPWIDFAWYFGGTKK